MKSSEPNMDKLLAVVNIDHERIRAAKQRHAAVYRHEKPDRWPIRVWTALTPAQEKELPAAKPDYQVYTFENRLYRWLRSSCSMVNARSDLIPFVFPDFGSYSTLACLGLESKLTESGYWAPEPLPREKIKKLKPEDIQLRGRARDAIDFIRYVKKQIGNTIDICCAEVGSPFGVAQSIMGHEIFTEIYDNPNLVHDLLEISTELIRKFAGWMKEAAGVPLQTCCTAGAGTYSENFGLQIDDDESVLLSPESINEFSMPYLKRLAEYFGGASIHYCGRHDGFTRAIWEAPELKGINFGAMENQKQDFEWIMKGCLESNTVNYGGWYINDDESVQDYLKRLYHWAAQGCLIPCIQWMNNTNNPKLDEIAYKEPQKIIDFWEHLHTL